MRLQCNQELKPYTTMRVGGHADLFLPVYHKEELATVAIAVHKLRIPYLILGGGSNACISDLGVRGLTIHNLAANAHISEITNIDCGCPIMRAYQLSALKGLSGLEFAVGIPGSIGGALVSNAGAYRENICEILIDLEVVERGELKRVTPDWMGFSYRDSKLRREGRGHSVLISARLKLVKKGRQEVLKKARENQRQRIFKQPWNPSAGSFFKNVNDYELAQKIPGLTDGMRANGVVPSGMLTSLANCKGLKCGGAEISNRHGNFVINRDEATATDIYNLTRTVKKRVFDTFGVTLEEEVLFLGDWSKTMPTS